MSVELAKDSENAELQENIATLQHRYQVNWNWFRYVADFTHLLGIFVLIYWLYRLIILVHLWSQFSNVFVEHGSKNMIYSGVICFDHGNLLCMDTGQCTVDTRGYFNDFSRSTKRSVSALSWKTQVLYFWVYVTRYLDLFDHYQTAYLVVFKITYIATSLGILASFRVLSKNGSYEEDKDTVSLVPIVVSCFVGAVILNSSRQFLEIFWTFSEYLEGFAMVPQYVYVTSDAETPIHAFITRTVNSLFNSECQIL